MTLALYAERDRAAQRAEEYARACNKEAARIYYTQVYDLNFRISRRVLDVRDGALCPVPPFRVNGNILYYNPGPDAFGGGYGFPKLGTTLADMPGSVVTR
jgi:hypothetical protein